MLPEGSPFMRYFRYLFNLPLAVAFVFIVTLASCEKEVHIKLASSPTQLVVQGGIENGLPPYVFLTSTMSFFSNVDLTSLQNSFIHGADIRVACGTDTAHLLEYSFDTSGGNKFYVYTIDTASIATAMIGQVGKFYTLIITYNSITYTSTTKIPNPKGVDSMWFAAPLFTNSKTPDSAVQLFASYTDPDTLGNSIRYFTKRNNEPFFGVDIFNDQIVNGKTIDDIALYAGYDKTAKANEDSLRYFYPGDTVTLKWSAIDKAVYDFWNSFAYANNALGNPFASPINLKTNMSNGALGIWGGYGSVSKTIVVPH
jgi:Domain of unknown function (DUF4249)